MHALQLCTSDFFLTTMRIDPHIIHVGHHSGIRLCACSHAQLQHKVHPKWCRQKIHGSYHALHEPKATQWENQLNCIPYIWPQPASTTHHAMTRAIAYSSNSLDMNMNYSMHVCGKAAKHVCLQVCMNVCMYVCMYVYIIK